MAKDNLIIEKKDFEEQLKSQISKGNKLLSREVREDNMAFQRPRMIIKIKSYNEDEEKLFLADCRRWDSYNSALIRRSFDDNDSPYSYFSGYGRTGNLTKLLGEDIVKEVKHQISEKINYLKSIIEQLPLIPQVAAIATKDDRDMNTKIDIETKDVFIVHGHDSGLKNEVARFVADMGYNPIILHEQPNHGKTIIEKIETFSKGTIYLLSTITQIKSRR